MLEAGEAGVGCSRIALTAVALLALALGFGPAAAGAQTGELYAFGSNASGQLGSAINVGTYNPVPAAVSMPGATGPVTQVSSGIRSSLVLTSTAQVYAFGENKYGQLGTPTGNETATPNPAPALVALPGATGPVTQVAAGLLFSLEVTSTGQLFSFGDNDHGQLGRAANSGSFLGNPFPALVSLPGATGPITQVAAGSAHALALTSSDQLYAFGSNRHGQLGNATNGETDNPNPVPALVSLPGETGSIVQIAAGWGQSLALTSSGQLFAFGRNTNGELGNTTNVETETPNPVPALVSLPGASGPIVEIAAGYEHAMALTSSGQLYSFGSNVYGQLGRAANSGTNNPNPKAALVTLPGATGQITQISAGQEHSVALTSTGQIYTFGSNQEGQLGRSENLEVFAANPVPALVPLTIPAGMSVADLGGGSSARHTLVALVAPSPPDPRSLARTAKHAVVKNGKAMVTLSCSGPASCSGELVLKAKLKVKKKKGKHPTRSSATPNKSKPVEIGSAAFAIGPGKKRTITVSLKAKAVARVKAAGKSGLRAQVSGDGVKPGSLLLKAAPAKPRSRK
jgi:alpha-tubulin suppressor-like RCC1 family protein